MASPQGYSKFLDNNRIDTKAVDEDLTTAAVPSAYSTWYDMDGYSGVVFIVTGINLTGAGANGLSIMADAAADGSGGNVEIVAHAVASSPASEGDSLVIECSAEQIRQEGVDNSKVLRYVAPKVKLANANDECVVTCIRVEPRHAYGSLTPDSLVY